MGGLDARERAETDKASAFQITLGVLAEIKELGMHGAWIQPGAADDAVGVYIGENDALAGMVVYSGPCILVNGDALLAERKRVLSQL